MGGVAFERRAHTDSHYARTPARARHGPSGGVGSCSKRSRTAFASQSRCWEYWSVYDAGALCSLSVMEASQCAENGISDIVIIDLDLNVGLALACRDALAVTRKVHRIPG